MSRPPEPKEQFSDRDTEEQSESELLGKRDRRDSAERARRYARAHQGGFLRQLDRSNVFLFHCLSGHKFMLLEAQLSTGEWCPQCASLGLSQRCLACQNRTWCRGCSRKQRQLLRDLLQQENQRLEKEKRDLQNTLLAEARSKMLGETPKEDPRLPQHLRLLLGEVGQLASRKAQRYLAQNSLPAGETVSLAMLEELFRILIMPASALGLFLRSLTQPQLRQFFRQSAVLIHPDKNPHPAAKVAFQKLLDHYERVAGGA